VELVGSNKVGASELNFQLARVREATDRLDVLRRALAAAERLEQQRKIDAQDAVRQSQNNAIRQHVGRAKRAAQKYVTAITNAVAAYDELHEIAQTVDKLMPSGDEGMRRAGLSYLALRDLAFDELCRQGLPDRNAAISGLPVRNPFPGAHLRQNQIGWHPALVTPRRGTRRQAEGCPG
jgi:hypothetical protein